MKKTTIAILSALTMIAAMPVHADDWTSNLHPYIGADYQLTHLNYNSDYAVGGGLALDGDKVFKSSLNGFNVHVGVKPSTYWGAEIGYFDTINETKHVAAGASVGPGTIAATNFDGKAHMQGGTLDALGYLPVGHNVDLIGTTGLAYDNLKVGGFASKNKSEIDWRVGAGAQVALIQNVNLRAIARYQTADFKDIVDNAWVYTVGINYSF